jgi:predicted alpha-1,2-mannosidase
VRGYPDYARPALRSDSGRGLSAFAFHGRHLAAIFERCGTFDLEGHHVLCCRYDLAEDGRYFSGADNKVHVTEGHDFYISRGLWGSYRSLHPLQLLLDPQRIVSTIRSYIRLYEQGGWMLSFGRPSMIGHHIAALTVDAYMKGYRDFEVEKAYEGLKRNAMQATMIPWRRGPATSLDRFYMEKGFFPALPRGEKESVPEVDSFERRQSVGVTLEAAYDDWCLAELAKALNKQEDYTCFSKRARNYQNVFDTRIGFMRPKTADGKWVEPFDSKWSGGQGGRDYYTEMNAWIYTFHVQQDVAGLIHLMGGREAFTAKLDTLPVCSGRAGIGTFCRSRTANNQRDSSDRYRQPLAARDGNVVSM